MSRHRFVESSNISPAYARVLIRAVSSAGHDVHSFLQSEGVSKEELEGADKISAALLGRLYERAILLLNDESIGLVSGGPVPVGTFRMMCLCVIHRPNLAAIVRRASEFFDICNTVAVKPCIDEDSGIPSITFATTVNEPRPLSDILNDEGPFRIRTSFYMWHSLLSWFAGRRLPLQEVAFGFEEPQNGAGWSALFQCPVKFNAAKSLLSFESESLASPNVQTERSLIKFLHSAPQKLIAPSFSDHQLSDRVLALFGDDVAQPLPRADEVGKLLGMSVSTLRRQLRVEGTSFQMLKDDCRREAAVKYLNARDLSFYEIATRLGFDEPSAFYRAFKRWTGCTPSEYRDGL